MPKISGIKHNSFLIINLGSQSAHIICLAPWLTVAKVTESILIHIGAAPKDNYYLLPSTTACLSVTRFVPNHVERAAKIQNVLTP
ncbi:hypothetical protein AAY473_016645, partial [Plecturocebus cupreus]